MNLLMVNNLKKYLYFIVCFFGIQSVVMGQYTAKEKVEFCEISIDGQSRPKGLVISQEFISNHGISSTSGDAETFGRVRSARRRSIKLKAPIINNPGFKLVAGFKYKVEDVFFEEQYLRSSNFYSDLENKNLKQLGASLYAVKPLRGNTYLLMRASASLNGDYGKHNSPTKDYLKYSIAPMIGWRKSDKMSYAFGVAYSENFGRISVFPIVAFNKTFNERWGTEILLPLKAKLRYSTLDKKNFLYLTSEIKGSTYNVAFNSGKSGYLNNTELRHLVTYEREIYDFLWVSAEAGLRSNLNFSLSETADHRNSVVISNRLNQSFFAGFSIFLVPPKKMFH